MKHIFFAFFVIFSTPFHTKAQQDKLTTVPKKIIPTKENILFSNWAEAKTICKWQWLETPESDPNVSRTFAENTLVVGQKSNNYLWTNAVIPSNSFAKNWYYQANITFVKGGETNTEAGLLLTATINDQLVNIYFLINHFNQTYYFSQVNTATNNWLALNKQHVINTNNFSAAINKYNDTKKSIVNQIKIEKQNNNYFLYINNTLVETIEDNTQTARLNKLNGIGIVSKGIQVFYIDEIKFANFNIVATDKPENISASAKEKTQQVNKTETDVKKLQNKYLKDIDVREKTYNKLLAEYSTNAGTKLQSKNLESRKLELNAIKQLATKFTADYQNKISATDKQTFAKILSDAEYHLKLVNTQLEIVALKNSETNLGDDFLDKVITTNTSASKKQTTPKTSLKTAKDLNPNNEGKELFEAIHSDNTVLALQLLKKGINLYYEGEDKRNYSTKQVSLSLAVVRNNMTVVKAMLSAGAYPDLQITTTHATALTETIRYNLFDLFELLVQEGADVNLTFENWNPLLQAAFNNRDIKFLKLLIDSGANPNVYYKGESPLYYAILYKNEANSKFLESVSSVETKIKAEEVYAQFKKDREPEIVAKKDQVIQPQVNQPKYTADQIYKEEEKLINYLNSSDKSLNPLLDKILRSGKDAWILYKTKESAHKILFNQIRECEAFLKEYGEYTTSTFKNGVETRLAQAKETNYKF